MDSSQFPPPPPPAYSPQILPPAPLSPPQAYAPAPMNPPQVVPPPPYNPGGAAYPPQNVPPPYNPAGPVYAPPQPYPPQNYPPQGYPNPPPANYVYQQAPAGIVGVGVVVSGQNQAPCTHHVIGYRRIGYSAAAWIWCIILFFFFPILSCLPFCIDDCIEKAPIPCPNCGRY
jgi:hypothetical protein